VKPASHLIHIGFPKCASTYLQRWFASHPDIHFADNAFGGFADAEGLADYASQVDTSRLFVTSAERLLVPILAPLGDYTIDKAINDQALQAQARVCNLLASLAPGASILIVLRGYAELFHSLFSEYLKLGGREKFSSFVEAMKLRNPEASYFNYDRVIKMYEQSAGTDRVLVLPYELLRDNPEKFLRTIEDRFGLGRHRPDLGKINPRLSSFEMDRLPRIAQLIAKLPAAALRGTVQDTYVRWVRSGIVNRFVPRRWWKESVWAAHDPFEIDLSALRGTAASLLDYPDFDAYQAEYLNDGLPIPGLKVPATEGRSIPPVRGPRAP
jgi:hypothetical protein